jgi:hypothetical protein
MRPGHVKVENGGSYYWYVACHAVVMKLVYEKSSQEVNKIFSICKNRWLARRVKPG